MFENLSNSTLLTISFGVLIQIVYFPVFIVFLIKKKPRLIPVWVVGYFGVFVLLSLILGITSYSSYQNSVNGIFTQRQSSFAKDDKGEYKDFFEKDETADFGNYKLTILDFKKTSIEYNQEKYQSCEVVYLVSASTSYKDDSGEIWIDSDDWSLDSANNKFPSVIKTVDSMIRKNQDIDYIKINENKMDTGIFLNKTKGNVELIGKRKFSAFFHCDGIDNFDLVLTATMSHFDNTITGKWKLKI